MSQLAPVIRRRVFQSVLHGLDVVGDVKAPNDELEPSKVIRSGNSTRGARFDFPRLGFSAGDGRLGRPEVFQERKTLWLSTTMSQLPLFVTVVTSFQLDVK